MSVDVKPGETKPILIVHGAPVDDIINYVSGWLRASQPAIARVMIHNATKSSDVEIAMVKQEMHVRIVDTEFKFYNQSQKHDYEPTEIEYIEMLMDDFGLTEKDTIGNLIDALEKDDNEEPHDEQKEESRAETPGSTEETKTE
jgi:hypothetical protein